MWRARPPPPCVFTSRIRSRGNEKKHAVQTISRRVLRKLHPLGYPEAGSDATVATGYDPLVDDEPALAHTLAASVRLPR